MKNVIIILAVIIGIGMIPKAVSYFTPEPKTTNAQRGIFMKVCVKVTDGILGVEEYCACVWNEYQDMDKSEQDGFMKRVANDNTTDADIDVIYGCLEQAGLLE